MRTIESACIGSEEDHCDCFFEHDPSRARCCHCGIARSETLFDGAPYEEEPPRVLPERVALCTACDGIAYASGWGEIEFETEPFARCCSRCKGSGIEGMTSREAYLREFPPAKP